jgi:hypothetical protein
MLARINLDRLQIKCNTKIDFAQLKQKHSMAGNASVVNTSFIMNLKGLTILNDSRPFFILHLSGPRRKRR